MKKIGQEGQERRVGREAKGRKGRKGLWSLLSLLTLVTFSSFAAENAAERPVVVYRGQLINGANGEKLAFGSKTNVVMTFRAYDGDDSNAHELWCSDGVAKDGRKTRVSVPVDPDGSFACTLGDNALIANIVTGKVTHVGVTIADSTAEVSPRRMLLPLASVTRALLAEGVAKNAVVGTFGTENLYANNLAVETLEAKIAVVGRSANGVTVKPTPVEDYETTIVRGKQVNVLAAPVTKATVDSPYRGQALWTADANGMVLIHSSGANRSTFRIPGVVQFVRKDDVVRAPTSEVGAVSVEFYGYAK